MHIKGAWCRYVMVGSLNTTVCATVMWLGAKGGLPYLQYTLWGYLLAMLNSFLWNRSFTFSPTKFSYTQLGRFLLINSVNLGSVEWIEHLFIEKLLIPELPAVVLGMIWYTVVGYGLNRKWVFSGYRGNDLNEN